MCDCQNKAFIADASLTASLGKAKISLNKLEDVGEVRQKLSLLEDAVAYLADERDRLESKLQPIRVTKPDGLEKGVPSSPSSTEIGNRLQNSIDRVRHLAQSFNTLREDLGL